MPEELNRPDIRSGFAFLRPANHEARCAFSDLAALITTTDISEDKVLSEAAKFMFIEPFIEHVSGVDGNTTITSSGHQKTQSEDEETDCPADFLTDTEGSFSEGSFTNSLQLRYQGRYIFDFDVSPRVPGHGWVLGVGRSHTDVGKPTTNSRVDILLAPPGSPRIKYDVSASHARLFFDRDGTLTLAVVGKREAYTALGNEDFKTGRRIIVESKTRISFGNLSYIFCFREGLDETEYQKDLRIFFSGTLNRHDPAPDFSATPSPMDTTVEEWLVRATIGNGAFGTVNAAKHRFTGRSGAAKLMIRNSMETHSSIMKEIDILGKLPHHPQVLRFLQAYYERGDRWYTGFSDESDERYTFKRRPERVLIIFRPFARFTFSESVIFTQPKELLLGAFHQILQGIDSLHSSGFIHRDIKPANLGVVSYNNDKIEAVILDYGQTILAETCNPRPGRVGTIPYLAPEMERQSYSNTVDIWACGIVGLQLFVTLGDLKWRQVTAAKSTYEKHLLPLLNEPPNTIGHLLGQMLDWDPQRRISAGNALRHMCFAGVLEPSAEDGPKAKQARLK